MISRSDLVRQLEAERSRFEAASESFDVVAQEDAGISATQVSTAVAMRWIRLKVRDAMSHAVVDISRTATLAEAARRMVEHRIHRLPVVENGQLVGSLSTMDILRVVAEGNGGEWGSDVRRNASPERAAHTRSGWPADRPGALRGRRAGRL